MNFTGLDLTEMDWNQILSIPNLHKFSGKRGYLLIQVPSYDSTHYSLMFWDYYKSELSITECDNIPEGQYIIVDSNKYLLLNANSEKYKLLFEISVENQKNIVIREIKTDEYIMSPTIYYD